MSARRTNLVGLTLICVHADHGLREGRRYTVLGYDNGFVAVADDAGNRYGIGTGTFAGRPTIGLDRFKVVGVPEPESEAA